MNILIQAAATLLAPFLFIGGSIGAALAPTPAPTPTLGASEAIPTTIAFFETTLAASISSSATTFTLTSAVDKDGTTLASSTYAFVIDEGSSNEEIVIADCTATACTNAERGISARTGNTEVTALKKAHRRGASVKMTDAPLLPLVARILRGEGTVEFTPSTGGNLVTKTYVDSLALGITTVAATLIDDGIGELATGVQAASSTATDQSGSPLFLHTGISTSTAPTTGSYIPVTGSDGNLDAGFLGNFASTTTFQVGDTPLLSIGKYIWASTTAGTSTWSVPSGVKRIKVTVIGGGGNGGGHFDTDSCTNDCAGEGGASGAVAIKWYDVSATSTLQFHVGSASRDFTWLGGTYDNPVLKATAGGNSTALVGGVGGVATGGDINIPGNGGTAGADSNGGTGAATFLGGGMPNTTTNNYNNATQCGAGGSGRYADNSASSASGGTGGPGCIIIEY